MLLHDKMTLYFSVNNIIQPLEGEWSTFWVPLGMFPYIQSALEVKREWDYTGNKSALEQ